MNEKIYDRADSFSDGYDKSICKVNIGSTDIGNVTKRFVRRNNDGILEEADVTEGPWSTITLIVD